MTHIEKEPVMSKAEHEYLIVRRPMNVNELPDHELGDVIPFPTQYAP